MKPSEQARKAAENIVSVIEDWEMMERNTAVNAFAQIIEDAMRPQWISVEDRLPGQGHEVWVDGLLAKPAIAWLFQEFAHDPNSLVWETASMGRFGQGLIANWAEINIPPPPKENQDE